LATAESYYQLRQTELASKNYEWLIKNAPEKSIQADAAFRAGDLYLERDQFSKAVVAYSVALRTFPKEAEQNPAVYLNLGEAYFRMGDLDRARDTFQIYAKKFSWETNGWRASLRLGEIENAEKAQGGRRWFMESINRYPLHSSSVLARLYLLGCGDQGGFNQETAKFFLDSKEVQEFDGGEDFYTDRYRDFARYLKVEILTSFGEYEEAIRYSNGIMPQFESNSYRLKLHKFRDQIFKKLLTDKLKAGEDFEALTIAEKYMDQVDPTVDAVFNDIWPRLLSSANQYRLINFSQKLLEKYSDQGQNLKEGRQIASLGGGPAVTVEQLELAKKAFLKAKSRWGDELTQGLAFSAETVQMLQATPDASPFSGEAGLMAAKSLDAKGKTQEALKQAIKAASLLPSDQKEWLPQVQYWLSLLYAKSGNEIAAAETLRTLRKSLAKGDEGAEKRVSWLPIFPGKKEVALEEARILDGLRRYGQAVEVYEDLLKDGVQDNKVYYLHAQSILQSGDKKKYSAALSSLEKVKNSKVEDFWKGLAQKSLDDFRDFYNAKEGANGRTEHKQSKI
jgi:tetratricopeptide (TPR) repeat protein